MSIFNFLSVRRFCVCGLLLAIAGVLNPPLVLQAQTPSAANVAAQPANNSEWQNDRFAGGIEARTPNDLKPGETYSLTLYGAQNPNEQTLSDFLKRAIQNHPLSLGEIKDLKIDSRRSGGKREKSNFCRQKCFASRERR